MTCNRTLVAAVAALGLSAGAAAEATCQDTALYDNMQTLGDNMRPLVQDIRGNDLDSAEQRLATMRTAVEDATDETPYELQGGGDPAEVEAFRDSMTEMLAHFDELEAALAEDDAATAGGILQRMGDMRRDGHRRFKASSCED